VPGIQCSATAVSRTSAIISAMFGAIFGPCALIVPVYVR
jgi:hypothetical protein